MMMMGHILALLFAVFVFAFGAEHDSWPVALTGVILFVVVVLHGGWEALR